MSGTQFSDHVFLDGLLSFHEAMGRIFREFHGISCNSQGRSTKRPGLQQYKIYENLLQSHDELKKVCMHLQWWALQRLTGTNFTNSVVCSSLVTGFLMISLVFGW
jgi:hypothetical protein